MTDTEAPNSDPVPVHTHAHEWGCTSACPMNPWHGDPERCIASTDRHTRCTFNAIVGTEFCRRHTPKAPDPSLPLMGGLAELTEDLRR